ncbi:lipopolysaccharide-binding protein isoform X1 [Scomber scombrus]|uniref:lipopolysaccharide-binding protein isoform X1 n=1 Tax=Scomber scombrus TaxID=13677 RepID=UPI002DDC5555|nr:lipopolysaccharide-binding protein isoform X1 [Scomber scombrus]
MSQPVFDCEELCCFIHYLRSKMVVSVIVALMLVSCTCGENPAIQVVLTDKGLQYGKHVGAGWIQEKLELVTLPDISGKVRIGILGSIGYTLTGVRITKCDFPEPSVEFNQGPTGFKTSTSGLSIAVTGGWRTHYKAIHDGGTFNMALFNVDVTSVVELGKDPDGHISVNSVSCNAQIGNLDIEFSGGASWIFQPFVDYFKGHIRGEIEYNICPTVEKYIVNAEQSLQAMNVSFEVNEDLTFDIPLTGLPVIEESSLNLGFKGEFYSIKTHQEPPFEAQPFVMPVQSGYMLSAGLSEFTVNSASYGYYSAGLLQAIINDSMIPPSSPVHLNTSSMGPFIPQLPKMFPGLLMTLQVYATEVPQVSFHSGAVKMGSMAAVKAFAIQPNSTQTPLFKLLVDSEFSSKVWIAEGKLKGSMTMDNFTLSLDSTEVGTFNTDALASMAKMGVKMALSKVNKQLTEGITLPRLKHAQLVNPVLTLEEGFIAICSDAELLEDIDFN